jgi:alpha-N-arabinofuranosidase
VKNVTLQRAQAVIDRDFEISQVDPRIYGGFIEHMGRCVYGGIYDPERSASDELGFRNDVKQMVKELRMPIIRYPGGNFVSGFNWEDSVGPREQRPIRMDAAWKSIESNQVGLHEFARWAEQVDSTVMMAVNLGTRGVAEAAQLLEYCNVQGGTGYSKLRKAHGQFDPYGFKVWCLGNEMDGPWQICQKTAAEYGALAREAGKVMKRIDPSIELVACGSSSNNLPTYPEWDATVLDACYDVADYLSVHMYLSQKEKDLPAYLASPLKMDDYLRSIIATCDYVKAKKRSAKTMYLSFDEWNAVPSTWKGNDAKPWIAAPALCEGSFTMADTVVFGGMLITLLKHSDRVRIACLAQLVNIFGVVMTEQDGRAWKQSIYYPLLQASVYGRGTALHVKIQSPVADIDGVGEAPLVDAVAVLDEATGRLAVFAINRSLTEAVPFELDLRGFGAYRTGEQISMSNGDPNAVNTADNPNVLVPESSIPLTVEANKLRAQLPPLSWSVLLIDR